MQIGYQDSNLNVINTKAFTFDKTTKRFIADISDLTAAIDGLNLSAPLRTHDGRETTMRGFILESQRTGKQVQVFCNNVQRDPEGDIVAWHFRFVPLSLYQYSVIIYND